MPYRRPTALVRSEAERGELAGWARRRRTAQALALRARIVLRSADGLSNTAIAHELGIAKHTVGKWRERFARLRGDGLLDEPRPGAPRRIGDEEIAALVDRTLATRPKDATHWSLRTMARATGLSVSTVGRVWRAFGLQPHRAETFKLSADPLFAEKVPTSSAFTSPHPTAPSCCAWTRRARCRRSTAPSRSCRCGPARPSAAPTTMSGMARPACSRLSMSPLAG
jgi:transposase